MNAAPSATTGKEMIVSADRVVVHMLFDMLLCRPALNLHVTVLALRENLILVRVDMILNLTAGDTDSDVMKTDILNRNL
jgi:hypothetical protein